MSYLISGVAVRGGISTTLRSAEDALEKALVYEAGGFKNVKVRDGKGNVLDSVALGSLVAAAAKRGACPTPGAT